METTNQQNEMTPQQVGNETRVITEPKSKSNGGGMMLTLKGLLVAFLILVLLIPTYFISNLIDERLKREEEVRNEVSSSWANEQTAYGPILVIPYKQNIKITTDKKDTTEQESLLFISPETLNITGNIDPFEKHRSIFTITVYQSDLKFNGKFSKINLSSLNIPENKLLLDKAFLLFNLSDLRGLEEELKIKWDDQEMAFNNETPQTSVSLNGLVTPVSLTLDDLNREHHFSFDLKIKGSESLKFVPIGKTSTTHISSPWSNPSFIGSFLPNNPNDTIAKGFSADWKILDLNRNLPQIWRDYLIDTDGYEYGVKMLKSTDSYAKTQRSVKYAILFISLTFALYFFIEILQNKKMHPLQYILVGMALCIFYTLLLSISEYISFNGAYLIAASATVVLITLYTQSAFGKRSVAAIFGGVLTGLYGFIFILIQLQDGALLFGSIGLFVLLAAIMYYSRKIDWYGQKNNKLQK